LSEVEAATPREVAAERTEELTWGPLEQADRRTASAAAREKEENFMSRWMVAGSEKKGFFKPSVQGLQIIP
jgi:hypothetical protein